MRRLLHGRGLRFRVDFPIVVGGRRTRPDIVFTRCRVAVFIDGCFWHGCPEHGTQPKANADYWRPKLLANRRRDLTQSTLLRDGGWQVLRFWEHVPPQEVADAISRMVVVDSGGG